ncbi:hypothetical protein SNE25_31015 [Mucilaginibacter sabulilitoris]|uniref:PH domain-containing protein n=1 Tax=Mucilaginibacter sabulilitoris TaxID=1173583 RepID=A0ABZ0TKS4_9SPHI|nr:hypothetical protein [Mucilaginibacter sabulilitoris]WPU93752.1 hypothetical protein SNE25_31015 [Mucilaginibacter sabulilitoris]
MEEVTSRRHWKKFYLNVFILTLYFLLLAFVTTFLYKEALTVAGEIFIILISSCLVIMAVYTIIRYFKNIPKFHVNTNSIKFTRKNALFWKDLERVQLSGKQPFSFMLDYPREGMMLKFKGSREIYLYDDMYANTAAVKQFITRHILNKSYKPSIITKANKLPLNNEQFVWYEGRQLLNFRGAVLWLVLGLLLYAIITASHVSLMVFLFGVGVVCFWAFSAFMYCFGTSDDCIMVRNPNLFWAKTKYRLTDIQEVVFEQQHSKMPYSLRIITNDFKSDLYMAGTLSGRKWRQLQKDLEGKYIKVRNELYFDI